MIICVRVSDTRHEMKSCEFICVLRNVFQESMELTGSYLTMIHNDLLIWSICLQDSLVNSSESIWPKAKAQGRDGQ